MPSSLSAKPAERSRAVWEGENTDLSSSIPQCRFSISTAGEITYRPDALPRPSSSLSEPPAEVQQHELAPSTPRFSITPSLSSSRVERLVRERQLRKSGSCYTLVDEFEGKVEASMGSIGGGGGCERGLLLGQGAAGGAAEHGQENVGTTGANVKGQQLRATQRLLVVANRLPVSAQRDGDTWDLKLSAGGLVSALLGVKQNFETRWIGWAGVHVHDEKGRISLRDSLASKGCVPVFLDDDTVDQYYNGYCNNVLWPLFHYIGLSQEDRLAGTQSLDSQYIAYKHANQLFADVVFSQYQEGDVVWCHDYHLMFLPKCLKNMDSHMKVGWFLHTPFPSSEIFRTLPMRSELLRAVLTADLIGFHTYDYARHFVSACTRILGLEGTPEGVEDQGKLTRVAAFPIGIDPERFIQALETDQVKRHIKHLHSRFSGCKVMLGVDRLDMIKGIPQKLLAFEMFLEKNPDWREKVLLVQIAVPTRTDVHEYQRLTSQVHEIVGRINGRFGTLTFMPIHHLDRSLAFHQLCALYAITDVFLVTSLRDGMNLVSYEFVACQNAKKGVLVLSEFSGAAQSLGAGAILVNPWNIREMYMAIEDALNMPETESKERHKHNFSHVTNHTAQAWADTFVSELNDTIVEAELRTLHVPPTLPAQQAVTKFQDSKNRLLILGFSGTITAQVEAPRRRGPDQIKEMKLQLNPGLRDALTTLCSDLNTIIVILSGSERTLLDEAFAEFDLWLAAENGMFLRHTHGDWMTTMPEHLNMDWVESVQLVFDYFCERTPRSYVESRETSLVWNYKYADLEFGRVQAQDMLQHLWTGPISNAAVDVVQGTKSVEVRPVGVSKGSAIDRILHEIIQSKHPGFHIDFVMCIGHFLSKDEDVYTYFDPEPPFERYPHHGCNGKTERALDRRLAAKSCDRLLAKSNKGGVVQTKSFPLASPEQGGSHVQTNSLKDRRYTEQDTMELELSPIMNITVDTYFSCAVGQKRSAARYSIPTSDEVVVFLNLLANTYSELVQNGDKSPYLGLGTSNLASVQNYPELG
ncbi:hypothetical protein CY35_17G019300 [Sphagnum magellanicum]|nr:hypothetical protein CY35_17G019300 [Sphagnum magellanicum]KAH9534725.1 hypothetical protein CY35_17G019300 [Sphagnum magellanicum]KAH9534726.1 hypothetical protein CY35_17G019300 [Sphagnum magellanicum]KAH9534727.1 hypothetical protein CY35_17G019300 [Sphagnum magellanicum]KAH9534728.1 hypothetical protein CY35_17G019300 [Sphagnum magellanicum]